ncbi:hypothetical protein Tco_1006983 [Tanacetum coccineum]|uniref:Uncharacterized protein n=1 Tax=Tanacetum coccineum TaxID=301880 RepID=A0ABQ5FKF9_9ASTR
MNQITNRNRLMITQCKRIPGLLGLMTNVTRRDMIVISQTNRLTKDRQNLIRGMTNTSNNITLAVNDRNPLVSTSIVESNSEVEVVFDKTANLRISTSGKDGSDKGYGTNSLLEQKRDSYPDNDDYDPYDDDMYENHDMSEHLQSICDDLDITVRGRKKK